MKKKILAAFIVAMMIVPTISFFTAPNGDQGRLNSIGDALNMTPSGVTSALYLDVQEMRGTPLGELLTQEGTVQHHELYNAEITRMCIISFEDGTWVEFHQTATRPRFSYATTINHQGYDIVVRENEVGNVLIDPIIYGPIGNLKRVISIIEGDATSARDDFSILEKVYEPAEFERVSIEEFAECFYLGIHRLEDGRYQRTAIYQSPSETKATNLTQLAETAPSRGLEYNVRRDEGFLIITIVGDFRTVIDEPS